MGEGEGDDGKFQFMKELEAGEETKSESTEEEAADCDAREGERLKAKAIPRAR